MTHDEYLDRIENATDSESATILEHAESCAACRRDWRVAERALAPLRESPASFRLEDAASIAAVAAVLAIAIGGLSSWNGRAAVGTPAPVARYRIVGGPSGVVAYTPNETIVATGGGARASNDEKEIHK